MILFQYDEGWRIIQSCLDKRTNTKVPEVLEVFESLLCFDAWLNKTHYWDTSKRHCISFISSPSQQHKMLPTSICHMTSLTSSAMFHPSRLRLVYSRTEAISEMSLHLSILSSRINKLLPTPSIDNKTASDHPTMINLYTLAHPSLLPSLTHHL